MTLFSDQRRVFTKFLVEDEVCTCQIIQWTRVSLQEEAQAD